MRKIYQDGSAFARYGFQPRGGYYWGRIVQALLMVRVAVDLRALQLTAEVVGSKVPWEILDRIRKEVAFSPFVWKSRQVLQSAKHDACIKTLNKEIGDLSRFTHRENEYIWRALFPGERFGKPLPECFCGGYKELDAMETNQELRKAWMATPSSWEYLVRILRGILS